MDKDLANKGTEGASSDEEEAFESADEGDEGAKSSKPSFATSAGNESSDSTSKDVVDENDKSRKSRFTSADSISSEIAELEEQTPEVNENVCQETAGMEQQTEDILCTAEENSPCSDELSGEDIQIGTKTLVKEGADNFSTNVTQHETKATENQGDTCTVENKDDTAEAGKFEDDQGDVEVDKLKCTEIETKLGTEETTETRDNGGQNQFSENLDKEQGKDKVEQSIHGKVEVVTPRPDSSAEKPAPVTSSSSGGWGWGGWSSMLSQATASVTSGLSSVIETVETSLGVPDPEEMARKVKEEEKAMKEKMAEENKDEVSGESKSESANGAVGESFFSAFGVSSLTSAVQTTGIELVSGGLDALEFIGKKTMNVLAEGDPGLRQKREKLAGKGPSLSEMLREAKEESEQKGAMAEGQLEGTTPTINLFSEFDKFQGLAHLEALEMLSHDSEAKLESRIIDLAEEELAAVKPLLRAVEEVFHIDEDDADDELVEGGDFKSELTENVKSLNLPFTADKIVATQERAREWVKTCVEEQDSSPGSKEGVDIYSMAVSSMAELTARTVELFHKLTELLLHQAEQRSETSSLVRAQCVRKMADAVLEEISVIATHFAGCLNTAADDSENPDSVSSLITTLYLDSSTSADYLRNSLKLLRPVLQLSSLNEKNTS